MTYEKMDMYALCVATPETVVFDGEVESLIAPGTLGYLEILAHHAALITPLKAGNLTLMTKEHEKRVYVITGGFLEVSHNRATVLADSCSPP